MNYVLFAITVVAYAAFVIGVPAAILTKIIWPLRERHLRKKAHETMCPRRVITEAELQEIAFRPDHYNPQARDWAEQPD